MGNGYKINSTVAVTRFYSAAALHATQSAEIATAIPSVVRVYVRLSVTRWYCTQTNEDKIMQSSL